MAPESYDALIDRVERISHLRDAAGVLSWDQQVTMPEGGAPARGEQLSALSGTTHELLTDDQVGAWLDALEGVDLDPDQEAIIREVQRRYEKETAVPEELVEEHTQKSSDAQQIWQEAKEESDFESFADTLDELRELREERALHIDPEGDVYQTMYDDGMPTLPYETVDQIFEDLKEGLIPLIEEIKEEGDDLANPF
ncbi:MAG: carboxypeptidase M32, partial [Halobacteriaceae archaeon]